MPKYIQATQDGIVRLSFKDTPEDINGLYTDGLQSCIALILIGKDGISLIHDTGKIDLDSIREEIAFVGELQFWSTAFNPQYKKSYFQGRLDRLLIIEDLDQSKYKAYGNSGDLNECRQCCKDDCVFVSRNCIVSDCEKEDFFKHNELIEPLEIEKRNFVNTLNNIHAFGDDKYVRGDLQFNGKNLSAVPELNAELDEIEKIASRHSDALQTVRLYKQHFHIANVATPVIPIGASISYTPTSDIPESIFSTQSQQAISTQQKIEPVSTSTTASSSTTQNTTTDTASQQVQSSSQVMPVEPVLSTVIPMTTFSQSAAPGLYQRGANEVCVML